ncbi:MAG: hypothetical protein MUF52_04720 [Syntrophobacteraceae bacterium]|jgi:hypothetical protein|nr:hypothetical protein [Syntrophobacteraceae bacterium]
MSMMADWRDIPWDRLLEEVAAHSLEGDEAALPCAPFVRSLTDPFPPFAALLLAARRSIGVGHDEAVRDLYFFLLRKRYEERLNLLHFAFLIFDELSQLPREVIDRTPFPHEDGLPRFGDPSVFSYLPVTAVEG